MCHRVVLLTSCHNTVRRALSPIKDWGSLLQKRTRTFPHILGVKQASEKFRLQRQAFRKRQFSSLRNGLETGANCEWRELGDLMSQTFCFCH